MPIILAVIGLVASVVGPGDTNGQPHIAGYDRPVLCTTSTGQPIACPAPVKRPEK